MRVLRNLIFLVTIVFCDVFDNEVEDSKVCKLSASVVKEIESYQQIVDRIINETVFGQHKSSTYRNLANLVDKFGSRQAGSESLENAIDYMLEESKRAQLDNVHGERATVPRWVRGNESALLVKPRRQNLGMLGLGSSVGTPPEGIRAEAIVVRSFDELKTIANRAKGKIVVFNQEYRGYGESVPYRTQGASVASRYGAVATLIRSITPFSLYTPHTGEQFYDSNVTKIPTACITVEDAKMLQRMQERGEKIVVEIKMEAKNWGDADSKNTVAELVGSDHPEKLVIVSGHLDSWDVGQGAMDDGGGAILSWSSVALLKAMGLRAKRTIRAILWTGEEEGIIGAAQYIKQHENETQNINFVMESDEGTFTPHGLEFSGTQEGACILKQILQLFERINATQIQQPATGASDSYGWINQGIPGASLFNEAERYFWYHHSNADTMEAEDPVALDKATALWAGVAYIIADLSFEMPSNRTVHK